MIESSVDTIKSLITSDEFLGGLVGGLIVLLACAARCKTRRHTSFGYAGWTGVILVAALYLDFGTRPGVTIGLVMIAAGGWLIEHTSASRAIAWLVLTAGAIVFTWRSNLQVPGWALTAFPLFILAVGNSLLRWRDIALGRLIGPAVAISAVGIWATVPDTDMAKVLLGCTLPLLATTSPPIEARISSAGSFTMSAMVAWVAVQGGTDRPASIIGAWACFTVIVVAAALARSSNGVIRSQTRVVTGIHIMTVLIASRLIGLGDQTMTAVVSWFILAGFAAFAIGSSIRTGGDSSRM